MVPEVTSSRPAIRRSRVDLPQPDGPTKTTNSRSFTCRSMPLMMDRPSKPFCRFLIFRLATVRLLLSIYFTAPKDKPRTNCFWLIQPKIRIGAQDRVETADNLAQNKPSGLE